jgi:hypothetical protein
MEGSHRVLAHFPEGFGRGLFLDLSIRQKICALASFKRFLVIVRLPDKCTVVLLTELLFLKGFEFYRMFGSMAFIEHSLGLNLTCFLEQLHDMLGS